MHSVQASRLMYLDEFNLNRVNSKKTRLGSMLLDVNSLKRIQWEILIEFTHASNAIEGSPFTIDETHMIMDTGKDFMAKSPYFHRLTVNHTYAFEYIRNNMRKNITANRFLELHEITMRNIDKEAGQFRDQSGRNIICGRLTEFLEKLNNSQKYHIIEKSALLQGYLHRIRPFNYGTGSIARLASKWMLNNCGYVTGLPLNPYEVKYYRRCAEKAGKGTVTPLVHLMAMCVEETLDLLLSKVKSLNILPVEEAMKNNRLMSLAQNVDAKPYTE